jgi:hypothetical protein
MAMTPESTRMTAIVPSEKTAFFLIEGFLCTFDPIKFNAIKNTIYNLQTYTKSFVLHPIKVSFLTSPERFSDLITNFVQN